MKMSAGPPILSVVRGARGKFFLISRDGNWDFRDEKNLR